MYLNTNKKIEIHELNTFKDRFKSLKFNLEIIDYGLYLPKKKILNTYFFCQKVDACFTDNKNKILYLYKNVKSEKLIIKLKSKNLYILPLNTVKHLKIGDKLNIK